MQNERKIEVPVSRLKTRSYKNKSALMNQWSMHEVVYSVWGRFVLDTSNLSLAALQMMVDNDRYI